jgi:hypothetical protein
MLCCVLLCSDLVVVHEALGFGHCHLALGVPMGGKFADVATLEQLRDMPCWTGETPLRVVTGVRVLAQAHASLLKGGQWVLYMQTAGLQPVPLCHVDLRLHNIVNLNELCDSYSSSRQVVSAVSENPKAAGCTLSVHMDHIISPSDRRPCCAVLCRAVLCRLPQHRSALLC